MNKLITILILFVLGSSCYGQSFDVRSIFNSGATFGIEYLAPSSINDSLNFQLTKYKIQFVKVLRTKEVDIERFNIEHHNARANQLFLSSKFSLANPTLSDYNYFRRQFKVEFELIYITISKKRGVWFHSTNLNAEENNETFPAKLSPNFRANSIYIHAKNLNFVPFIGPGISITQGKFYVLPIFGFGAKMHKNLRVELIVPVHAKLKYNYKNKAELEFSTAYSGIQTVYREGIYLNTNRSLNLKQLKMHLGVSARLNEYYKFKVELGYASLQRLDGVSLDYYQKMGGSPFINFSFNYNFGNSILYSFFNEEKIKI